MTCGDPRCTEAVRYIISSVQKREETQRQCLCNEHGHQALDAHFRHFDAGDFDSAALIEFEIDLLVNDIEHEVACVYLRSTCGARRFGLVCGVIEASLLLAALTVKNSFRPLTYEAMVLIANSLGAKVNNISINERLPDGNTFKANVNLVIGRSSANVDMRPTDALGVALRSGAPIFVAGSLLAGWKNNEVGHEPHGSAF